MGPRFAMLLAATLAAATWTARDAGARAPEPPVTTPLLAEPLGLRMQLPPDSSVASQVRNDRVIYNISAADGSWSMRLEVVYYANPGATAETLAHKQLEAVEATGRRYRVLADENRECSGVEGRLLYVRQSVENGQSIVNGWLVLPRAPQTFLLLSMVATDEAFARISPLWDESFSTIELFSEDQVVARRDKRLAAGRAFVETLTEERLRTVLGKRQWFRIYKPADRRGGEETEVGFMSLHYVEAPRGQLTPERVESNYRGLEAELGLMVLLEARAIIDAAEKHYVDVQSRFWMSWDRDQEAWSVRMTQRQGDISQTSGETGVRDRFRLKVITSTKETRTRDDADWTITDRAYLSQPEVFCLGSLLPRAEARASEMEFFFYDPRHRALPRRIDRWQPVADGNWELLTRSALDANAVRQTFTSNGERLRRIDGDGKITERIDPQTLRRLWESKGLITR